LLADLLSVSAQSAKAQEKRNQQREQRHGGAERM
jgi:hypothetical protein